MAGAFVSGLRDAVVERSALPGQEVAVSDCLSAAMHQLDWALGLRHQSLVTSPLWLSPPYLLFVHHLLAHAGQFAQAYNAALHDYRLVHHLRTAARPMPDLAVTDRAANRRSGWMIWLAELRTRAAVACRRIGWKLIVGGDELPLSASADGWRRPSRWEDSSATMGFALRRGH